MGAGAAGCNGCGWLRQAHSHRTRSKSGLVASIRHHRFARDRGGLSSHEQFLQTVNVLMKRSAGEQIARAKWRCSDSGANRLRAEIPSLSCCHADSHSVAPPSIECACAWHGRSGVADSAQENIITIPARQAAFREILKMPDFDSVSRRKYSVKLHRGAMSSDMTPI